MSMLLGIAMVIMYVPRGHAKNHSPTQHGSSKDLELHVNVYMAMVQGGMLARRATFVLSILALAPSLSSPREAPQVDRSGPQTFRAKHMWAHGYITPTFSGVPQYKGCGCMVH